MPAERSTLTDEPVSLNAAFQVFLAAVFGFFTAFDIWHPTDAQLTACVALFVATNAIGGLIARHFAVPKQKAIDEGWVDPTQTGVQ